VENDQQKPNVRRKKEGVKQTGSPAGNSETTMKSVGLVHIGRAGEFQILGAANEVRTNGTESRLVLDKVREQVE